MHVLKMFIVIGCSFSVGWFTLASLQSAIDRINDWREHARWAVLGSLCVAGALYLL